MLSLELTDEHLAVADLARSVGLDVLSPAARQSEAEAQVPSEVWKALAGTGLTAAAPAGGEAERLDTLTQMVAAENFAYGDAGIALAALWSGAATQLISQLGSAAHRDLLSKVTTSQASVAVALYEGFGRGPSELDTTIQPQADGTLRIVGKKVGVPAAADASHFIVIGTDRTSGSLRAALVESGAPGVTVHPTSPGLALDAAGLGSVSFDVAVPADRAIGDPDTADDPLRQAIDRFRLLVAAVQIGTAQRAVDYASKYAVDRIAFGKPIAGFQGVSFPLAEAQMRISELRLELNDIASGMDLEIDSSRATEVTRLVNYAGEVAAESTRNAVQTLGGHGFITDHPVELWYRSAAALAALDFDLNQSAFQPAL